MKTKYIHGLVYLGEGAFSDHFTVEGDRFVSSEGSSDRVVDLEGKLVLPGFNDSHLHLVQMSQSFYQVDLKEARSISEIIERAQAYLAAHPDTQVLYGRGWNEDYFSPDEKRLLTREDLDAVSKEIPVLLERVCGHVLSGNSRAIAALHIKEDTYVPGGEIRREKGVPTGIFTENAVSFAKSLRPSEPRKLLKKKIIKGLTYGASRGLTSMQSCDIYEDNVDFMPDLLREIYEEDLVLPRYFPQFNFHDPEKFLEYLEKYNKKKSTDRFGNGALKLFKDGSLGAETAELSAGYIDCPKNKGTSALDSDLLLLLHQMAQKRGVSVLTHAIGDKAIREVLQVIDRVCPGNPLRHGIVHCQITDPSLLEEIREKNIYTLTQPVFLDYDISIVEERVGPQLSGTSYAFGTLHRQNPYHESFGTDAPVEDLNPFANLYHAVTRKRKDGTPEEGFHPEESLTLSEAIDIYTLGSAYIEHAEQQKGRIQKGYLADFIILKENIFQEDPEILLHVQPEAVYIGGKKFTE